MKKVLKQSMFARLFLVSLLLLIFAANAASQETAIKINNEKTKIPSILFYEGYITDTDGKPLIDGKYSFQFAIYTSPQGGTPIWSEEHQSVEVINGNIQLHLGRGSVPKPLDLPFDKPYFLGIRMNQREEILPRLELMPSGYSFRARIADDVPDASITTEKLAVEAVTDDKIKDVSWNKITGIPPMRKTGTETNIAAVDGWALRGNTKTDPPKDFIGTTDSKDLVLKTNSIERVRIGRDGNVEVREHILMHDDNSIGTFAISSTTPGIINYELEERITFDKDGNDIEMMGADVGIGMGTETPEAKFHVKGKGEVPKNHIALFENSDNEDGVAITEFQDMGIGLELPEAKLHVKGTGEKPRNHIALFENSEDETGVAITNDQDVSVGLEEPIAKLHVRGIGEEGHNHVALFENNSDEKIGLAVTNKENIGMGTHTPEAKLHVQSKMTDGEKYVAVFENMTGGNNGIGVKINAGYPDADNHYIDFLDSGNGVRGRVEGQNATDLLSDPKYILFTVLDGIDLGMAIADMVGASTSGNACTGLGAVACPPVPSLIVAAAINLGSQAARTIATQAFYYDNLGVSFSSGSGDYAEYLERVDAKDEMETGDIVGVFGGKVTHRTKEAQQIMVVSMAPIVLGNMPPKSDEHLYEKIAFMGQVPVKVVGPVKEGDYIIPSGFHDGTGIAVPTEMMTAEEFTKVVGRSWSSSDNHSLKLVNVAVGLNSGDIATFVQRQMVELENTRSQLSALKNEVSQLKEVMRFVTQRVVDLKRPVVKTSQN